MEYPLVIYDMIGNDNNYISPLSKAPGQTNWEFHRRTFNWEHLKRLTTLLNLIQCCSTLLNHVPRNAIAVKLVTEHYWGNLKGLSIPIVFKDAQCCSVRLTGLWIFVQFAQTKRWPRMTRPRLFTNNTFVKFNIVQWLDQCVWPRHNRTLLKNM